MFHFALSLQPDPVSQSGLQVVVLRPTPPWPMSCGRSPCLLRRCLWRPPPDPHPVSPARSPALPPLAGMALPWGWGVGAPLSPDTHLVRTRRHIYCTTCRNNSDLFRFYHCFHCKWMWGRKPLMVKREICYNIFGWTVQRGQPWKLMSATDPPTSLPVWSGLLLCDCLLAQN